jgi:hypothetical protein
MTDESAVRVLALIVLCEAGYTYDSDVDDQRRFILHGLARDELVALHPASHAMSMSIPAFWTPTDAGRRVALQALEESRHA